MKRSKEIFLEHREAEAENQEWNGGTNWIEPIIYPWSREKEEPASEVKERQDNPIAEHDEREWKAAFDKRIE